MRTIKRKTLLLNQNKHNDLEKLCCAYASEKNHWLDKLRSWKYQALLGMPRQIRDEFVSQKYKSSYGLQGRHWKLALSDAVETWDKYWKALFVEVRTKISRRKNMSDNARHYAYWLLTNYSQFSQFMQGKVPIPNFDLDKNKRHQTACYVRRIIRDLKGKYPTVNKSKIAKFDADCYDTFEQDGKQYIKVMSLERGKRIVIPLKGMTKIEGNITIVVNQKDVEIHVSKNLRPPSKRKATSVEAVDFGYTEVMTDTQNIRYGQGFGEILTKVSNDRNEKMKKRHRLHSIEKKCRESKPHKAERCRKYNLGRKKLNNTTRKSKDTLERKINTGINELIKTKNPDILVTEKLSHTFTYNKPKSVNRKLSSWLRGKIQDRVSFKALAEGFRHEQVNPAYSSQNCPQCDFVDQKNRIGDRFRCLHCKHEDMADRVAAVNHARRLGDDEIGLYMSCSQVKTVLLSRFHRRLEAKQFATVPGWTLDTVSDVCPQRSAETEYVIAGRGNSLNRTVTQRAKQNEHV